MKSKDTEEKKPDGLTVWGLLWRLALFVLVGGAIVCGIAYGTAAMLSWGVPHIEALADDLMRWMEANPEQANALQFFLCTFAVCFVVFLHSDEW